MFLNCWAAVFGGADGSWAKVVSDAARKLIVKKTAILPNCRGEIGVIRGSPVNCAGIDCEGIRGLRKSTDKFPRVRRGGMPVAHPFRGERFHCDGKIVPWQRKPSGLEGLSYRSRVRYLNWRTGRSGDGRPPG